MKILYQFGLYLLGSSCQKLNVQEILKIGFAAILIEL